MTVLNQAQTRALLLEGRLLAPKDWYSLYYFRPDNLFAILAPRQLLLADEPAARWNELTDQLLTRLEAPDPADVLQVPKLPTPQRRRLWEQFVAAQPVAQRQQLAATVSPERLHSVLADWQPGQLDRLMWEADEALQQAWAQTQETYCAPWLEAFSHKHRIPLAGARLVSAKLQ